LGIAATPMVAAETFSGAMSGTWWNAQRSGEGQLITFETVAGRNVAFIAYFTYDEQRRASWMVGSVDFQPDAPSLTIPLVRGSGALFGATFASAEVALAPAGTATLEYVSCREMRLRYAGAVDYSVTLTRAVGPLLGSSGCPAATSRAVPVAAKAVAAGSFGGTMSGIWWNAQRSGEGQLVNFETVGGRNVAFLAYFTYDDQRRATWLVGSADFAAGASSVTIPLVRGSGAVFGPGFSANEVVITAAGTAILDRVSCGEMRLRYSGVVSFGVSLTRTIGPLLGNAACVPETPAASAFDRALRPLIEREELSGDAAAGRVIPGIDAPLAQLGKLLFFSKALSANLDVACATCHHPRFAGADKLALSIGAGAVAADVVGPGRRRPDNAIRVGRNANTYFNSALSDGSLFWDSRIESLSKAPRQNGAGGGIRTPDSAFGSADPNAGPNLPAAQARFPIVGAAEMRGNGFPGMTDAQVRSHVAARLGDYGSGAGGLAPAGWLPRFRAAFGSDGAADTLITFDRIMLAIGEYERSAVFAESPWARYVRGDLAAISDDAKAGALVFYRRVDEGGTACSQCHEGDRFTDERHHVIGFPQIGPGVGDGNADDFGRERQTGVGDDRYRHRTPSLLNVELTAPYGHSGAYPDLFLVFGHYVITDDIVGDFLRLRTWCNRPPFDTTAACPSTATTVAANTNAAVARMNAVRASAPADAMPVVNLDAVQASDRLLVNAFLETLTDPCLRDRACFGRWIPTPAEAPDTHQLNATDATGAPL
jgi:cytochrome c peroxidase